MQLLKNWWQGFAGGPDFNKLHKLTLRLEEYRLELMLPYSNIASYEQPKQINFPFRAQGWFEANAEQDWHHYGVHVHTEGWCYLAPIIRFDGGEYGVLWLQLKIKKVPDAVNALNRNELAQHVTDEYDAHYNSEVIGPEGNGQGLGWNTQQRKKLEAEAEDAASRGATGRKDRLEEHARLQIQSFGFPPLKPAQVISMHGFDWVFYQERRGESITRTDHYCLPLDKRYYLALSFKHQVDVSSEKSWQRHAEKAQLNIVKSLRLHVGPELDTAMIQDKQSSGLNLS
ncbi:hypothetical protein ABC502_18300 [Alkalimonas sp. NCh-2]|uniref:Uncharacterized protein n=1 Tax=Alkalimonas amylolytica TaxID=152573 RepID=A0A1H3YIC9_ALKAM|nr:hypothetical protein [Alkalimonas amylolytica]SEA10628.1 hypothetical protein SAMN04488051_101678 [Alkalimonas amylolytica]